MASIAENMAGNDAAVRHLLADARAAVIGVDYPPGAISVLQAETLNGFFTGDFRSAKSAASQGVRLALEAKDRYTPEMMQLNLGSAALLTGDLSEARPLLEQALMLARQIDDRVGQFYLLDALCCHAALTGNARRAAQLFGAADTARTEAGANVMRFFAPLCAKARESAVSALGLVDSRQPSTLEGAWAGTRQSSLHAVSPLLPPPVLRLVHLRAHRRQPRPQHHEQAGIQLPSTDSRLDRRATPVASPAARTFELRSVNSC
jgi:hypothetical protein